MAADEGGMTFREFVALILFSMFGWLLYWNPTDQTIVGALLTGFAAAWGFYLGGSKVGSDTAQKNADTVAASAAATLTGPTDVTVVNPPSEPVPTTTDAAQIAEQFKEDRNA
jgi:hypothetical protein